MFASVAIVGLSTIAVFLTTMSTLNAQELDYCSSETPCNCEEVSNGYDSCNEFDPDNLIDVSAPAAVRNAYNIESNYAETFDFDIFWKSTVGSVRMGQDIAVWLPVNADNIEIDNEYYRNNNHVNSEFCGGSGTSRSRLECMWLSSDGVCGAGKVERGAYDVNVRRSGSYI